MENIRFFVCFQWLFYNIKFEKLNVKFTWPGHVAWILLTCGSLALVTWPGYSSPVDPWPWSRVLATWPGYFSPQCSRQALLNGKIKKVLWIIPVPVAHVNNQRQGQRTANRISKATATRYKACTARYGLIYRNYWKDFTKLKRGRKE